MTPRSRSTSRKGWPDNLYPNRERFKYRHPVTKKEFYLGSDKAKAFAAAKKLNALLVPTDDLISLVITPAETVADAIAVFRRDDMPHRQWSAKNAENYGSVINRIEKGLGDRPVADLSVKDVATFIREVTHSPRSRQQIRLALTWILACAVQEGWADRNVAADTRKLSAPRQRARLTIQEYRKIWAAAPVWVRNAMDVSLLTLLRREDVVNLRFSDVRDDALWVVPGKTEESTGLRLSIAMTPDLSALLSRCRDDVASPFIVHRLPARIRSSGNRAEGRLHHTQVLPEQLTRAFADARDTACIKSDNPPTFHEIRSLGGALLKEAGWSTEQIQALMGHSAPSMTEHYLGGHEQPWQKVAPGIKLPSNG